MVDGSYWSDLEATKESREMWIALMTPPYSERLPEVGVFMEDDVEDEQPVPVVQLLIGTNGLPVQARVMDTARNQWLIDGGQNRPGHPLPTCLPPTYQVRPYF